MQYFVPNSRIIAIKILSVGFSGLIKISENFLCVCEFHADDDVHMIVDPQLACSFLQKLTH